MTTTYTPQVGDRVTGCRYGSTRRVTVVLTTVAVDDTDGDILATVGLLAYASTFIPGGQYEGSFRGRTALDPATVRPAD
jgi:hypothetical protein